MIKCLAELVPICINKDYYKNTRKSTVSKHVKNKQRELYDDGKKRFAFNPDEQMGLTDAQTFNNLTPFEQKIWGVFCTLAKTVKDTQQSSQQDKIWLSPKAQTIADAAGCTARTYFRAINRFIELGWLERYKCNNTNGRQNNYAPAFFKIKLAPSAIKKTMMLLTSVLQLLSFTNPCQREMNLKGFIYNDLLKLENTPVTNSVNIGKKTLTTPISTIFHHTFLKKDRGEETKLTITSVVEELAGSLGYDASMEQLRRQARMLLYRDLKGVTVTEVMIEDVVKKTCALVSKKRGKTNLDKTKVHLYGQPTSYIPNTPKTNKIEPQANRAPFELVLFCLDNKIDLTPKIIDRYVQISDDAEREDYKSYIKFLAMIDRNIAEAKQKGLWNEDL